MSDSPSWLKEPKTEAEVQPYLDELFKFCSDDAWNTELKKHMNQKYLEKISGKSPEAEG